MTADLQSSPTPADAAATFFAALKRAEWLTAASMIHPDAVARFREAELAMLVAWAENREAMKQARTQGLGFGYSSDGTLDPVKLAHLGSTPFRAVPGVRTLQDLAALSPHAFAALFLELSSLPIAAAESGPYERPSYHIVGHVIEDDSIAYVLYRLQGPAIRYEAPYHVDVLRLRRSPDGWQVDVSRGYSPVLDSSHFMMLAEESMTFPPDAPGAA
jgi:hypothetical protein